MSGDSFDSTLLRLFAVPPPELAEVSDECSVSAFLDSLEARAEPSNPADRALFGGFLADRIGTAFVAGYLQAVRATFELPSTERAVLAVTERAGGHPRVIATTLTWDGDEAILEGEKTFVTLGRLAKVIYVAARDGQDSEGRPRLRLARVPANADGLSWREGPSLPFVPEIEHAQISLTNVRLARGAVLEGDGYANVIKPFRTVEDIYVHLALTGYLLRLQRAYGGEQRAQLVDVFATLRTLADHSPSKASTHVALAGALAQLGALLEAQDTERWPELVRSRYLRDLPLRWVAEKTRAARLAAAWSMLQEQR